MYKEVSKLLLYSNLGPDSILTNLCDIFKSFEEKSEDKDTLVHKIYVEMKRLLDLATQYGFDTNLWHNYLTFLLITNENSFTLTCERQGATEGGSVNAFAFTSEEEYFAVLETVDVKIAKNEVIANIPLEGAEKNANVEVIFNEKGIVTSMTINVERTFGELMTNAALNTLLGMGTVFVVLILISFIISAFGLISKVEDALKNKASKKEIKEEAVNNTIAQIEEREELADDLELVAVIAAAIASYEGTSTDGFVVRSIRKANRNKWLNA